VSHDRGVAASGVAQLLRFQNRFAGVALAFQNHQLLCKNFVAHLRVWGGGGGGREGERGRERERGRGGGGGGREEERERERERENTIESESEK